MADLTTVFAGGIRCPNPFWLASGPPANCGEPEFNNNCIARAKLESPEAERSTVALAFLAASNPPETDR